MMKKLSLMAMTVLFLTGCSLEVRDADPEQEDGFSIDIKDERDDEDKE